jgi:exodeoxyribonuclease V gamma subunit
VPPPALDLDLALAPFRVTGRLAQFTHEGPLLYRCAKLRARDLIEAWLHHLGAGCARPGVVTTLLTRDTTSRFRPVPDPAGILRGLLDLYWEGMGRPLRFFPRTALAFMEAERAGNSGPLDKALATWEGGGYGAGPGEKEDLACDFCFRHELPLNEEFERHARAVLGPLLDHETRTEP